MEFKRHLAFVSYDGSKFHGFAKNKQESTVQYSIEKTLLKTFKKEFDQFTGITFSSRTDAGVHAIDHPIVFNAPLCFTNEALATILNHSGSEYIHVNSAIKNQKDFVGLTGYELRKELGSPTDIEVAWSDAKGLIQIFIFVTPRGSVSAALHDNTVIDVNYVDKRKK